MSIPFQINKSFEIKPGTYVFRIYGIETDEKNGKIVIHMVNREGKTHIEFISYLSKDRSQYNDIGLDRFGNIASAALNTSAEGSIEPSVIVGKYIEADLQKGKPSANGKIYNNIKNIVPAEHFEDGMEVNERALKLTQDDIHPTLETTKKARALAKAKEQKAQSQAQPVEAPDLTDFINSL